MRFLLLLVGFAGAAAAAGDERFEKIDYDRDGKVSLAEAAGNADLVKGFDRADRNRDGKLSRREYDRLLARAANPQPESAGTGRTAPKRKKN